jgi:hypothetical protein
MKISSLSVCFDIRNLKQTNKEETMKHITMSTKEINQIAIFEKLKKREITQILAAQILKLTSRQVRNKIKRYIKDGPGGLVHRRRGSLGNRAWCRKIRDQVMAIIKEYYPDFGPTFAAEKLAKHHAIFINKETLRKSMIKEGIWHGKKRKSKHCKLRERREIFGIMIQLDGSKHDWFEGRAPRCTLLVFIDDATSKIVWAEFVTGESVENVMHASYGYFWKYGLPFSMYVDNGSVFSVNTGNPDRTKVTQYERAVAELGIEMIHARSPQAKGRVERVNQTLQDRLVKEMRLANISTIDEANRFLREKYLDEHNAKFAVPAARLGDAHRPLDGYNLDRTLCIKEKRIVTNDFTISFHKRIVQIEPQSNVIVRPKDEVAVLKLLDGSLVLLLRSKQLSFTEVKKQRIKPIIERTYSNVYHRPAPNHPWRNYQAGIPQLAKMEVI